MIVQISAHILLMKTEPLSETIPFGTLNLEMTLNKTVGQVFCLPGFLCWYIKRHFQKAVHYYKDSIIYRLIISAGWQVGDEVHGDFLLRAFWDW